ncbi:cuticle protein CP14.6-like [Planococcus citri]|uniref:cuticle protein CP14.6-like n=1 Tax=Planococcus citri TaxID=170843 RepID=UPI0031F7805E
MHMKIAIISALIAVAVAAPAQLSNSASNNFIPIVAFVQDQNPDGSYSYKYETGNGIAVQAQAAFPVQGDGPAPAEQGSYAYTGPDGVQYAVSYVADSNGFQAQGAHLPTPPPMPEELARAFAAAPQDEGLYDERGFLIVQKSIVPGKAQ